MAIIEHLFGGFKRIRHVDVARGVFTKVLFIDDKTAADGVIGFAVHHFVAVKGVDLHSVLVQ
ncbi:hypothetical protein D3C80_2119570 [compost metagenome]